MICRKEDIEGLERNFEYKKESYVMIMKLPRKMATQYISIATMVRW